MKTIRLDERDLRKMINDAVRKVLKENAEYDNDLDYDSFSIAMNKTFDTVRGETGGEEIQDVIAGYIFDFDKWDNESKVVPCRYTDRGMYALLYYLCNYDIVALDTDSGEKIDVEYSNNPSIAETVEPYVKPEICRKVYDSLYQ